MFCCFVPIATSIFVFVLEPSEGLNAAYITVLEQTFTITTGWWRANAEHGAYQHGGDVRSLNMCRVPLQPPDQVPSVQHHRRRGPGGVRERSGQSVGPGRLQRHGVYQGRPVHCGYGQHQGELQLHTRGFLTFGFHYSR